MNRDDTERWELERLAPYASFSAKSRGRKHQEPEDDIRTAFQRDRDRIIHSSAFRRLEYKTQVFVYHEGDYFRTRLTHTIEVAQIARTIARSLAINEDLTEAVALAHDMGHPPFGHSGEKTLNDLLKNDGGFNHNLQSLKIVEELEKKYPGFPGLNLTYEVREGLAKHATDYDVPEAGEFSDHRFGSLEAQVVDIADEIAYNSHDIDDGLASGMIDLDAIMEVALWRETYEAVVKAHPGEDQNVRRLVSVSHLIGRQVKDAVACTGLNIERHGIRSADDARTAQARTVAFGDEMAALNEELKSFLMTHLYRHYRVVRMSGKAERILRDLFRTYTAIPEQLPPAVFEQYRKATDARVISDYIAQMTDKFAIDEHMKLFAPYERV
jgi:dGTPase